MAQQRIAVFRKGEGKIITFSDPAVVKSAIEQTFDIHTFKLFDHLDREVTKYERVADGSVYFMETPDDDRFFLYCSSL